MASIRLKQKWHANHRHRRRRELQDDGPERPTVSAPGGRVVLVMARSYRGGRAGGQRAGCFCPAARCGFGVVQRAVRGVQECLERRAVARMHGHADADGERRLLAVPRHPLGDAPGHVPRRRIPCLGQYQGELVPAEPRGGVDPPARAEQRFRTRRRARLPTRWP